MEDGRPSSFFHHHFNGVNGRATFIITQRLVRLEHAGCILMLDHGRIIQRGMHDDLLTQEGLYRQIYDLQSRNQEAFTALAKQGDNGGEDGLICLWDETRPVPIVAEP